MTICAGTHRFSWFLACVALASASCDSDPTLPAHKPPNAAGTTDDKVCAFPDGSASVPAQVSLDAVCGCTRVDGDLSIDASSVSDIRCLSSLREVTGKLAISASTGSSTLANLTGLDHLQKVQALSISGLAVTELTVLENLRTADSFQLTQCDNLTDLRGLRADITEFWLEKNSRLRSLDGFVGLAAVPGAASGPSVRIEDHPELESLEGLFRSDHQRVRRLQLIGLPKIERVDLRSASELDALVVRSCSALQEIRGVESIGAMSQLHLTGLTVLPSLPGLTNLRSVVDLELIDLPLLRNLAPLSSLVTVDKIAMSFMDSLSSLSGLENVAYAQRILVEDLFALESLDGLRGLQSVGTLWLHDDDKLESLRGLNLTSALELAVRYNDALQTLEGLEMLGKAGTVDVSENPVLVSVRALGGLREASKVYARANGQLPQCALDWLAMHLPEGSTHEFNDNGPAGSCSGD